MDIVEGYIKMYQEKRDALYEERKAALPEADKQLMRTCVQLLMEVGNEAMEFVSNQIHSEFESEIDELRAK